MLLRGKFQFANHLSHICRVGAEGSRILLLLPVVANCLAQSPESQLLLLRHRVALAEDKQAFLQLDAESIQVLIKGLSVKRLPVKSLESAPSGPWRRSRVKSITPAEPPRGVVVHAEQINPDTLGSVSSAEEMVSVSDMPDGFSVALEDGSLLLIVGETDRGTMYRLKSGLLQLKVVYSFLWRRSLGRPVRLLKLELASETAREMFWLLRPGMGVIY